jgi:hypothetical protein
MLKHVRVGWGKTNGPTIRMEPKEMALKPIQKATQSAKEAS